ncbi:hypothetical protein PCANC_14682 [Puccinia coronata f. sp. avenae]|uniref:Uncharacterized protein n=1 Tax=Puccinia coronata f. sp. avenae TaxID=200324 RepID=A0A2N5UCI8_9BASI|nr:hypothetical protein PCANC_14682 [Puccinia coronata f. sp. avenae]
MSHGGGSGDLGALDSGHIKRDDCGVQLGSGPAQEKGVPIRTLPCQSQHETDLLMSSMYNFRLLLISRKDAVGGWKAQDFRQVETKPPNPSSPAC